ncbi:MAG: hypothetical protein OXC31_01395, partial [Spirochaetaceae bacterium]|nr:hypothetical protein [Spirochaetaceae bacterium]
MPLGFTPYRHQRTAFSRLAAGAGRSTVVATGTGSGKTECFLSLERSGAGAWRCGHREDRGRDTPRT